jgi:hypothetical protein
LEVASRNGHIFFQALEKLMQRDWLFVLKISDELVSYCREVFNGVPALLWSWEKAGKIK